MRSLIRSVKYGLLMILLLASAVVSAQVTCTASAPSQVSVNQAFYLSFALNAKAEKVASVNFNAFNVLGGPSQSYSSSTSIVNGKVSSTTSYTYTYTLQATKEGTFTVPAVTFVVDGKQVKSNPVTIKVVAASAADPDPTGVSRQQSRTQTTQAFDKKDVFVKAYASKTNPYQGEQVIVTHKLYVGTSVNGGFRVEKVDMPTQSGFWSYTLGDPNADAPHSVETINGKKYNVYEVRRTALFPQKSGTLTVSPMKIDFLGRVIYQMRSNDFWDDFCGGGSQRSQDYNLNLTSNSITLNVRSLPENGRSDHFSGVVGSFKMDSRLTRNELKTNDAANLIVTIEGTGNLQHIEAPNINFPPDFDVTEPKITDNINTRGNSVTGSRSFEYILIPRSAGDFTLPPAEFVYFDNASGQYKTLQTDEYQLKVEKGVGDAGVSTTMANQKDVQILDRDIRFIKSVDNGFRPAGNRIFGSLWYWLLLSLPILLFVLFLLIWRKQLENRSNVVQMKDRRANKVSRKRLKKAGKLLEENKKEEFYVEISRALWGYMSDKFHIPLAQLSMETVEMKLKEKNLSEESISDFIATLNQCEYARFAPGDSTALMKEMYEASLQFITRIEKKN